MFSWTSFKKVGLDCYRTPQSSRAVFCAVKPTMTLRNSPGKQRCYTNANNTVNKTFACSAKQIQVLLKSKYVNKTSSFPFGSHHCYTQTRKRTVEIYINWEKNGCIVVLRHCVFRVDILTLLLEESAG